jgi:hypothetical protein
LGGLALIRLDKDDLGKKTVGICAFKSHCCGRNGIRSDLVEHGFTNPVFEDFEIVAFRFNPPIGGDVEAVTIEMEE